MLTASKSLTQRITERLIQDDPIGIYFPDSTNDDEYEPEAQQIAAGILQCESEEDCLALVYMVFVHFFGPEIAGPIERYRTVASDCWSIKVDGIVDRPDEA